MDFFCFAPFDVLLKFLTSAFDVNGNGWLNCAMIWSGKNVPFPTLRRRDAFRVRWKELFEVMVSSKL